MRLTPALLVALGLSGCVTVPTGGPTVTGSPAISPIEQQLNNRTIRSDVFSGQLTSAGFIEGNHDLYGQGGNWYVRGSTLCLNFGFNFEQCGTAQVNPGLLLHNVPGGQIGYAMQ